MPEYPALTQRLPVDSGGRRFSGPGGKMFAGTTNPANSNEGIVHTLLVDSSNNPLVVSSRVPIALRTPGGLEILPSPTTITDNQASIDATRIATYLLGFNGTNWDRLRGTTANGLGVDVTRLPAGAALPVADSVDVGAGTGDVQAVGATTNLRLLGFSVYETTGSAGASLFIRAGTSTAGAIRYTITLLPNESRGEWFGPNGIESAAGIFIDRTSGSSHVVIFYKAM